MNGEWRGASGASGRKSQLPTDSSAISIFLYNSGFRGCSKAIMKDESWIFSVSNEDLIRKKYNSSGTLFATETISTYGDLLGAPDVFPDGYVSAYDNTSHVYRIFDFDGNRILSTSSGPSNSAWYFGCNKYGEYLESYYNRSDFYIKDKNGTELLHLSYDFADADSDYKPFGFITHGLVVYSNEQELGFAIRSSSGVWSKVQLSFDSTPNLTTYDPIHRYMQSLMNMIRILAADSLFND